MPQSQNRFGFRLLGRPPSPPEETVPDAAEPSPAADAAEPSPVPDAAEPTSEPETIGVPSEHAVEADAGPTDGPPEIAWPMEQELRAAAQNTAPATASPAAERPPAEAPPRSVARGSTFMEGMARAMRSAAEVERERLLASLREAADAAVLAARDTGTTSAAELRRAADQDIVAIRQWANEEIGRIRNETKARLTARRERLAGELGDVDAGTSGVADQIRESVDAYEREFGSLFAQLQAESDPVVIARLAAAMPEPPQLSVAVPEPPVAIGPSAEPELETVEREPGGVFSEADETGRDDTPSAAEVAPQAGEEPAPLTDEEPAPHTGMQPASHTDESPETTLHVRGLDGIAAIAGYKWQLAAIDGVEAAQVTSGNEDELVIHIRHVPAFSIAQALGLMTGYTSRVVRTDGREVWAIARENGSATDMTAGDPTAPGDS